MALSCPHCNAPGKDLDWDREITPSGPIASIRCRTCGWLSPIVIDGRTKLDSKEDVPDVEEEHEEGALNHLLSMKAARSVASVISEIRGSKHSVPANFGATRKGRRKKTDTQDSQT